MTNQVIMLKLNDLIRDVLDQPGLILTPQTTAKDVAGWDSVTNIDIIVGAEALFKVKFRSAELDDIRDVGELVNLIVKKQK